VNGASGAEALALLSSGDLRVRALLPAASNDTYLAEAVDGDRGALAVYKPRDGEAPLWDFPYGTLCLREVAAYEVSEALGWGFVPPTVLRGGPRGVGSVQLFIDHDPDEHYFTLAPARADDFRRACAFDLLINNADRKAGHCLLESETGRVWLIDHGVSFHAQPKLRTVIWDFAGERIADAVLADLDRFAGLLEGGAFAERLGALLAAVEVEALRRRALRVVEAGAFPGPGSRRHYPWPPV
jgi:hypothetical protein